MCTNGVKMKLALYRTNEILYNYMDMQDYNQDFHYVRFLLLLSFSQWCELVSIDLLSRDLESKFLVSRYEGLDCAIDKVMKVMIEILFKGYYHTM